MKKKNAIVGILEQSGPCDSHLLAGALAKRGIELPAARKLIERSRKGGAVLSTYPVRFDKTFLYYLPSHKGRTYANEVKILLPKKPSFHRVYKCLSANKGWITAGQIGKMSGCLPENDNTGSGGRIALEETIERLKLIGLIENVAGVADTYCLGKQFGSPGIKRGAFQKKLELEQSLLTMFRTWLRDCYLLSGNANTIRRNSTVATPFNQSLWDIHGPVYFGPLTKNDLLHRIDTKENFLVAEILGFRNYGPNDAEATIERVKNVVHRWKTISLTSVVLAPSFSNLAWRQLRELGIVPIVFRNVFGRNVEELLRQFWKVFSVDNKEQRQLDEIEKSLELAKGTTVDEGLLGNLKGTLFELLIALALRAEGFDTTLQKTVQDSNEKKSYEIDVVAVRSTSCKLVECKGRHSDYLEDSGSIRRHFENRCRAASDSNGWNVTKLYGDVDAEFITSGNLDAEATSYASATTRSHGINCSVMTRGKLIHWLKELHQDRLIKVIDTYY